MARELGRSGLSLVQLRGVCLAVIICLPACTYRIKIGDPGLPSPLIEPLPLTVGIIFDPYIADYEFATKKWGDTFQFRPGIATHVVFSQVLKSTFSKTITLTPGELADLPVGTIDAAVYVGIKNFFAHIDIGGNSERVEITYTVTIKEPDSSTIAKLDFNGQSEPVEPIDLGEVQPGSYYGRLTREAIFDAATRYMIEFRDSPGVKDWLHATGAYRAHLGVGRSGDIGVIARQVESKAAVRVAIFSDHEDFRACLTERLIDSQTGIQVLDEQQIRNAFYPWIIDLSDPDAAQWIENNGAAPLVRQRIAEMGITHVVTTAVDTDSPGYEEIWEGTSDGMTGIGIPLPYGPFLFGVILADERTSSAVAVYGLDPKAEDTSFEQSAAGKIYAIAAFFPISSFMGRETDAQVCEVVANELVERLQ
ncbi:MAG: hypothetical protein QGH93_00400 [Gammaproteobacteria bacterium]|nr:hypothetical protein [Gammaproteobacteria bacterium]